MGSVLREVVIDCREPQVVASFWAEVLGWPLVVGPTRILLAVGNR